MVSLHFTSWFRIRAYRCSSISKTFDLACVSYVGLGLPGPVPMVVVLCFLADLIALPIAIRELNSYSYNCLRDKVHNSWWWQPAPIRVRDRETERDRERQDVADLQKHTPTPPRSVVVPSWSISNESLQSNSLTTPPTRHPVVRCTPDLSTWSDRLPLAIPWVSYHSRHSPSPRSRIAVCAFSPPPAPRLGVPTFSPRMRRDTETRPPFGRRL
jgi:hypothetical protein